MSIANRVKLLRTRAELTASEMAKLAGMTRQNFYLIESGKILTPSPAYLNAWAKYFDVSLDWIKRGVGDSKNRYERNADALSPDHTLAGRAMSRRLSAAMRRSNINSTVLSKNSGLPAARINQWIAGEVPAESVTAKELFTVSAAVGLTGHELLTGDSDEGLTTERYVKNFNDRLRRITKALRLIEKAKSGVELSNEEQGRLILVVADLIDSQVPDKKILSALRLTLIDRCKG